MNTNRLPSEVAAVVATLDPAARAANTYVSDWVPVKDFRRIMAIVMAGTLGASATLDAKLRAATSSAGAGATDIAGAAMTQMTKAGSDDNKQAVINLNTEVLAGTAFTHVALSLTTAVASCDCSAVLLGFDPLYSPASDADLASVDSITSV